MTESVALTPVVCHSAWFTHVPLLQLIHLDDPENVLLQFGRIGKDTFTMGPTRS